jgi:trimeric autotransporter adhesin
MFGVWRAGGETPPSQPARTPAFRALLLLVFAIAVNAQAQTACPQSSTLACGANSATLTPSDCASFDGSYYQLWTFSGTSGDTVTIEMASTSFDAFLALLDPNGVPLIDNDDVSSTNTNARVTFTLTSTGTWTVVANSLKASQSGAYTLTLSSSSCTVPVSVPRKRAVGHG